MNRRLPLLPLLLSAVFALTGITMAQARGQMVQGSAVVICSGYGVVTILVDSKGDPVGSVHPCPDCTLHGSLALSPGAEPVLRPATRGDALPLAVATHAVGLRAPVPQARAPPLS